ncbi:MAG: peptidase family protein [Micavibrio sp.]|nr:peptidase family protein [Micavibrio sp.]
MLTRILLSFLFVFLVSAPPGWAADMRLMLPAACAPGQDCWVVNYADMNPARDKAEDYTCGAATYDEHEGTDFGLKDTAQMKAGVSVLAAAPGKVLSIRDGLPDRQPTKQEIEEMLASAKGCGNGVLVDHGNGWQSIYCQMRGGTIAVKKGDTVTAGQRLGDIGQSGAAEFPHLHFGLFQNRKTIDPFSGTAAEGGCGKSKGSMWMEGIDVDYQPLSIFATGFSAEVPNFDNIRADATGIATSSPSVDVMAFWAGFYGLHKGDHVVLNIIGPDGKIFATQSIEQKEDRSRQYYFVGRKIADPLIPGAYKGTVQVERAIAGSTTEKLKRNSEKQLTVLNAAGK